MPKKAAAGKKENPEVKAKQAEAQAEAAKCAELIKQAGRLKLECELGRKDHDKFLLEREKMNQSWVFERDAQAERNGDVQAKARDLHDARERQQLELRSLQQKLKHLRFYQQDEVTGLKVSMDADLKRLEDSNRVELAGLTREKRDLKVDRKKNEVAKDDFVRMLKMEQDSNILDLRLEFDMKARDMQQKYELRMRTARANMEKERKRQIAKIEESKQVHIQQVVEKNRKEFLDLKNYFAETTSTNFELIKRLKLEHAEMKRREDEETRRLAKLVKRSDQLKEPLRRANQDVERLTAELAVYEGECIRMVKIKESIKATEVELQRVDFQHEVLRQKLAVAAKEREELYSKFQGAVYAVQQKSGFKNLLLEKKLDRAEEALETADAKVVQILAASDVDPALIATISQQLDQVMTYKSEVSQHLQAEVQRIQDAHRAMVKVYESKLAQRGIPVEEMGFTHAIHASSS